MELKFWAATDFGKHRDHNEDNYLIDNDLQLFVVCDGMGGHAAGEVASAITAQTVRDHIFSYRQPLAQLEEAEGSDTRDRIKELLREAIQRASTRVYDSAKENKSRRGMGTTCSLLLIKGEHGFIGHVGDSRIYRVRNDEVEQLTLDHSLKNELVQQGKIDEDESFPDENAITRAVGVKRDVEVDAFEFDIESGDRFLLCSDGLSNYIDESGEVFELMRGREMKSVVDSCIDYANEAGGEDNITVVLVGAYDSEEAEEDKGVEILEYIEKIPYFQHLTEYELIHVAQKAEIESFEEGDMLGSAGEPFDDIAIILDGKLEVEKDGKTIAELLSGDYYGELGFLDEAVESVNLRAGEACRVAFLRRRPLLQLLRQESNLAVKILWNISQVFCSKFRDLPLELYLDSSQIDANQFDMERTEPSTGRLSGDDSQSRAFKEEELEQIRGEAESSWETDEDDSSLNLGDVQDFVGENEDIFEGDEQKDDESQIEGQSLSAKKGGNTAVVDPSQLDGISGGDDESDSESQKLEVGDQKIEERSDETLEASIDADLLEETVPDTGELDEEQQIPGDEIEPEASEEYAVGDTQAETGEFEEVEGETIDIEAGEGFDLDAFESTAEPDEPLDRDKEGVQSRLEGDEDEQIDESNTAEFEGEPLGEIEIESEPVESSNGSTTSDELASESYAEEREPPGTPTRPESAKQGGAEVEEPISTSETKDGPVDLDEELAEFDPANAEEDSDDSSLESETGELDTNKLKESAQKIPSSDESVSAPKTEQNASDEDDEADAGEASKSVNTASVSMPDIADELEVQSYSPEDEGTDGGEKQSGSDANSEDSEVVFTQDEMVDKIEGDQ